MTWKVCVLYGYGHMHLQTRESFLHIKAVFTEREQSNVYSFSTLAAHKILLTCIYLLCVITSFDKALIKQHNCAVLKSIAEVIRTDNNISNDSVCKL